MINRKKLNFKISSGLKNIIGRELITGQLVAVFELVKNGYDADAKSVRIVFDNSKLFIIDDGTGMSYEDIINKWLFVAYSEKVNKNTSQKGKYYVGAKGVGRFSCDRLGAKLKITSKTINENFFNVIELDWDEFEQDLSNQFVDVPVDYYQVEESDFLDKNGTIIEISGLRDNWDLESLLKLRNSLSKLRDPFSTFADFDMIMDIRNIDIINELNNQNERKRKKGKNSTVLNGKVYNDLSNILLEKTVNIECSIDEFISIKLIDRGQEIYRIKKLNNTILNNINFQIFYLNKSAKINFFNLMGISTNSYGSVSIYKNGFRIYPYGEPKSDFFNLDSRKAQGYARYLGNREVLGAISIIDTENHFREVSSRDRGFENNIYLKKLEEIYMELVHKPLERYINLIKWGYDVEADKDILIQDIDKASVDKFINLLYKNLLDDNEEIVVSESVIDIVRKPTVEEKLEVIIENKSVRDQELETVKAASQLIKTYKDETKNFEKTVDEQKLEICRLENQNKLFHTLTSDEALIQGQISHHVGKVSNIIDSKIYEVIKLTDQLKDEEIAKQIREHLLIVKYQTSRLNSFKNIVLKTNLDTKSKTKINLFSYVKKYVSEVVSGMQVGVECESGFEDSWEFECDILDVSIVIDNLVSNAKEAGADTIVIQFISFPKKKIEFFCNSKPISVENMNKIFEYGYTTKLGGTGVGLYHVKQIVQDVYNYIIFAQNSSHGVVFTVENGEEYGI